jgi:hypothetical protein
VQKLSTKVKIGDLVTYQDHVGILLQEGDDPFDGAVYIDLFTGDGYQRIWIDHTKPAGVCVLESLESPIV